MGLLFHHFYILKFVLAKTHLHSKNFRAEPSRIMVSNDPIKLSEDGGVIKYILEEGVGDESPPQNSTVTGMHELYSCERVMKLSHLFGNCLSALYGTPS